ncbi:MAG: hydantoinase/oxoprolinase family protein [Candidatus Lokiarchaeota archaeon]|nr:hydantoinase/oxoprolinase family protein [Candidatus Lokiarchaeota archaeon]
MSFTKDLRIGVDTGGTFTDLIAIEGNKTTLYKIPSTPDKPEKAVIQGLLELIELIGKKPSDVTQIIHGTTVGINALLEGKCPPIALITTKGFADIIEIGRQRRPLLYNLGAQPFLTLVPRNFRLEIEERLDSHGNILKPLDLISIDNLLEHIRNLKVKSIAICFLFSFLNPIHEQQLRDLVKPLNINVSLSSEVVPIIREYERTVTTVINALTTPVLQKYLADLESQLQNLNFKCQLHVMKSNAGIATIQETKNTAVNSLLGGLAGGVMSGAGAAQIEALSHVITLDIGGTSCDVSTIEEQHPSMRNFFTVASYQVMVPAVEVETIGAGGGSIAKAEEGLLLVGPESQGAEPGPACYGKGGILPTVTDANLILGILDPNNFAGLKSPLKMELARKAIKPLASKLGLSLFETALGIRHILNNNMAHAIRKLTIERGRDPRDYLLIPFGGAGPTHATDIACELNISGIFIPPFPGIWSARGLLDSEPKFDMMQTILLPCERKNKAFVEEKMLQLKQKVLDKLAQDQFSLKKIKINYQAALQYKGQGYTLQISLQDLENLDLQLLRERFEVTHQQRYQWHDKEREVIIVDLWITVMLPRARMPIQPLKKGNMEPPSQSYLGEREVYQGNEEFSNFLLYNRENLLAGNIIEGPSIIQQMDTTTFIPKGVQARVNKMGYLIIDIKPLISKLKRGKLNRGSNY